jgi:hypothetical protein
MSGFDAVIVSEPDWPERCDGPRPGDLRSFVPQGFGMGAPLIITPYGSPPPGGAYGFDERRGHPFLDAPLAEAAGGTLYFDDGAATEAVVAALRIMGIYDTGDYVAFMGSSADPPAERYLEQLRLVTHMAAASLFRASWSEPPPKQTLSVIQAVAAFIEAQKAKWNDPRYLYSSQLRGAAGGDGDWAKESLAFGVHVENTYWGVYRVWSRPWLVTK